MSATPISDWALKHQWNAWVDEVREHVKDEKGYARYVAETRRRLEKGCREYGDSSFTRPIAGVYGEIGQEGLDINGWGFVAHARADCPRPVRYELAKLSARAFAIWQRMEEIRRTF